jgi:phage-related protein
MPSLPTVTSDIPRDLRQYLDRVRENIDGVGLDEIITARKLIAAGLAEYTGGNLSSTTGGTQYATPPAPLNLDADGALMNIIVTWDKAPYQGHAYTEIWAAVQTTAQAEATPEEYPDIGEAILVGMAPGSVWVHNIGGGASRWYWARFVNIEGLAGPFNLVDGTRGDTATDPAHLISLLSGQIAEGQLATALSNRIDLIDGGESLAGSVAARLATVQNQVNELLNLPEWDSTTTYAVGDQVVYNGFLYAALVSSTNVIPSSDDTKWDEIGEYSTIGAAVAAHTNQITALTNADTAQVQSTNALAAQMRGAYAGTDLALVSQGLVFEERTARASADTALGQSISTVSAFVNTKTRTFYQADEPTGTADQPLNEGDMWIDTDVTYADDYIEGDYVIRSNRMYRFDGTNWVEAMDFGFADWFSAIRSEKTARITEDEALAQDITTLVSNTNASLATVNQTLGTHTSDISSNAQAITNLTATVSGNNSTLSAALQAEQTARANEDEALAQDIVTAQATLGDDITAAVQVESTARATADGLIEAKNTIKVDLAGHVSGYGLISTNNTGTPSSEFGIRADAFWLAPPAVVQANAPTANLFEGYVWVDSSGAENVTKYYDGANWTTTPQALPFIVRTTPTTINGETVPTGVYMQDAFIANGTITNAKIGNAAIDDAKIANLDAGKITTGFLDAARIEAGMITAAMIDSRGLSIKDADGNVILSSGTPLSISNIQGLGTLAAFSEISLSDLEDAGALASLDAVREEDLVSGLAGKIDGKVESWFEPSNSDPSSAWTDNDTKTLHLGDIWWQTDTNTLHRYKYESPAYSWEQITDQKAIDAFDNAATAQDTADGKRRVFIDEPVPPYDRGDLWDRGPTTGIYRCDTAKAADGNFAGTDWTVVADLTGNNTAGAITDQGALATLSTVAYSNLESGLAGRIDGKVETFFDVAANDPSADWEGTAEKNLHLGDLWWQTDANVLRRYHYNGTAYEWQQITDQTAIDAFANAATAQDTADGKRRVFVAEPVPPYDIGDLWDRGTGASGLGLWRCITAKPASTDENTYVFAENDWQVAADTTADNTAAGFEGQGALATLNEVAYGELATALANLIDGKVEQHYGTADPSTAWTTAALKNEHLNDLWYKTDDKYLYVYVSGDDPTTAGTVETFYWQRIEDQDAIDAAAAASDAQDTADGKRRVFVDTPVPPYDVGDLWDRGDQAGGGIWRCKTARAANQSHAESYWQVVADATFTGTAAGIADQGPFATLDQITQDNISTYIAGAAITNAYIGDTIQSASYKPASHAQGPAGWKIDKTGGMEMKDATFYGTLDIDSGSDTRLVIKSDRIEVYDGGVLRVRLGNLS